MFDHVLITVRTGNNPSVTVDYFKWTRKKEKTFDVREERDYTWCSAEIKGDVI